MRLKKLLALVLKKSGKKLIELAKELTEKGAGELVINSIDKDGLMNGYDENIISLIKNEVTVPLTLVGGAGKLDHINTLVSNHGIIGAGAGSMFVFKGKYKAVLISYPTESEKRLIYKSAY